MPQVQDILDHAQRWLHDAETIGEDGTLWTRAELLDWLNDAYRALLAQSQATRRFHVLDVPGRFACTMTQEWEARFAVKAGTFWRWTHAAATGGYAACSFWEAEQLEGISPTTRASEAVTQPWEKSHLNTAYQPYRFALPRDNERPVKIWHDHKLLHPVAVRELDDMETNWISLEGEPVCWSLATGRNRTFEVFEIATAYVENYRQTFPSSGGSGGGAPTEGMPRRFFGSRTYAASPASGLPAWGYSYTTPGDSGALTQPGQSVEPVYGATFAWELAELPVGVPAASWPVDWTANVPDLAVVCSQPWEYNPFVEGGPYLDGTSLNGTRGVFPWERVDTERVWGPFSVHTASAPPSLGGYGLRLTQDAVDDYSALFAWEAEQLSGETPQAEATMVGSQQWEKDFGAAEVWPPLGSVRALSSPDRQYIPLETTQRNTPLGIVKLVHSSNDNLLLLQVVGPAIAPLTEQDDLTLVPAQLAKYLRYYVLHRAFGRQGEGHQPNLALFYQRRFERGVQVLRSLGNLARRDRQYVRAPSTPSARRPATVRLPSTYPRVRY
jgi:hypothetical protein